MCYTYLIGYVKVPVASSVPKLRFRKKILQQIYFNDAVMAWNTNSL